MDISLQNFLVLGISKSGYFACKKIIDSGGNCLIFEQNKSNVVLEKVTELLNCGVKDVTDKKYEDFIDEVDCVIISPGVPINHPLAVFAKKHNKKIIGEIEFCYELLEPKIIAVTGTNGKTTTVTMIDKILSNASISHYTVGNIGVPFSEELCKEYNKDAIFNIEISSFQLESVVNFKPHIACVLNITPDHLERHYTMDNYVFLKKKIFENLTQTEYAILNYDDDIVKSFESGLKSKIFYVSTKQKVNGAYLYNDKLYFFDEEIVDINELPFMGEHNYFNALTSIVVAKILGIKNETIKNSLVNFEGVKHRIQLIADINGVKFYDDSKSTNTASTICALHTINSPTILILGGSEKGETYDKLFEEIKKCEYISQVVLTGASRINMLNCANNYEIKNITFIDDFDKAVIFSKMTAKSGDNVLLSPACASFDNFKNYEERGDHFKSLVLLNEK